MRTKINYSVIVSIVIMATTVLMLGSCNADDEYEAIENGTYTLARKKVTSKTETPILATNYYEQGSKSDTIWHEPGVVAVYGTVSWGTGFASYLKPSVSGDVEFFGPDASQLYINNAHCTFPSWYSDGVTFSFSCYIYKTDYETNKAKLIDSLSYEFCIAPEPSDPPTQMP